MREASKAGRKGVGFLNAFESSGLLYATCWAFIWAQLGLIVRQHTELVTSIWTNGVA